MAVPAGIDLDITFSNGYATKVRDFAINLTAAALDTTGAGETNDFDTVIGGRRKITGTFSCMWDSTLATTGSTFAGLGGSSSAATFRFSDEGTDGKFVMNIIITGIDHTVSIDSALAVAFTYEVDGAPTITLGIV